MAWHELKDRVAEHLNIFPTSVHLQYRFSTDTKDSLPCDLTSQQQLDVLLALLRPLIVPAILANGRPSTRQKKAVVVQVFNKNDNGYVLSDGKVNHLFSLTVPFLNDVR
jgi:hypothetical protein